MANWKWICQRVYEVTYKGTHTTFYTLCQRPVFMFTWEIIQTFPFIQGPYISNVHKSLLQFVASKGIEILFISPLFHPSTQIKNGTFFTKQLQFVCYMLTYYIKM